MSNPIGHKPSHALTSKPLPWTEGNKELHEEISKSQVMRWTPQQIKAAEKSGYFLDLFNRSQAKRYGSLLEDEEELL